MKTINRRSFLRKGAVLSTLPFISSSFFNGVLPPFFEKNPDISIVEGLHYFSNTEKAVELIGGMKSFVSTGDKVGILINSAFDVKGAYYNPDIAIAVVKMCYEAGASEVICIQNVVQEYWERSSHFESHADLISGLKNITVNKFPAEFDDENWTVHETIKDSRKLKNAEIINAIFECDRFINMPISKHHATTLLTGALKNMMGICTRKTNVGFHLDSGVRNDPDYLAQCIADINQVRKPDLCVMDSTEFIVTNGPGGPGDLVKKDKVLAGTDIVAMDAIGATYLDYLPEEIPCITKAYDSNLGEKDYTKLTIKEIKI